MKPAAVLTAVVLAGGTAAGAAYADTVPLPTPTVPTVTTPPLPVQTPPAPSLPPTPVSAPAPAQVTTTVANTASSAVSTVTGATAAASSTATGAASGVAGPSGSTGGSSSGGAAAGTASSSPSSGAAPSQAGGSTSWPRGASKPGVAGGGSTGRSPRTGLRVSRAWIATAGRHADARSAVVPFRLGRRQRVVVRIVQVAPFCRVVATFSVVGHRGVNRVRIRSRIHGRALPPGTYQIDVRTPAGHRLLRRSVVVTAQPPTSAQLAAARRANACAAAALLRLGGPALGPVLASASGAGAGGVSASAVVRQQNASAPMTLGQASEHGAEPQASGLSPADVSKHVTSPLVLVTLGIAIVLLGLAALPAAAIPDPRLTDLVARHRGEVALAGAAALAAAIVALALG